jgi:hypothetical protein
VTGGVGSWTLSDRYSESTHSDLMYASSMVRKEEEKLGKG